MIRLTQLNGAQFLVAPDAIISSGVYRESESGPNYVVYHGDGIDGVTIRETPMDVARLRAVWELRHTAPELRGSLPITVGLDEDEAGGLHIRFYCCAITQKLREERAALRKPTLFSRLFGRP